MPCPMGVNIPRNFAMINEMATAKDDKRWRKEFKKMAKSTADLNAAKDNGMAYLCKECKKCIEKCPQQINVSAEMAKIRQVIDTGKPVKEVFK